MSQGFFNKTCIIHYQILGNFLAIIVLNKDTTSNSTNIILKSLAISGILTLSFAILNNSLRSYIYYYTESRHYNSDLAERFATAIVYFILPMHSAARYGTVVLTVMVTIDRYIAVCKPMMIRRKRNIYIILIVLMIYVVVYNIPLMFEYKVFRYGGLYRNNFYLNHVLKVVRIREWDRLHQDNYYQVIYKIFMAAVLTDLGPMVLLLVFNVRLYKALQEMQKRYLNMRNGNITSKDKKHLINSRNLTKMIVIVVTTFTILTLPIFTLKILRTVHQIARELQRFKVAEAIYPISSNIYYRTIANVLVSTASSVNFIIYILFARKFRKIFLITFCKCGVLSAKFDDLFVSLSSQEAEKNSRVKTKHGKRRIQPMTNNHNSEEPVFSLSTFKYSEQSPNNSC